MTLDGARVMKRIIAAFAKSSVALLLACFLVSRDEVSRVTSPSGDVDAVLFEDNGGATTSFGYVVYLVPRGKSARSSAAVASFYGAARSDQAYGINLRWRSADHLALEYLSARSHELLRPHFEVGERAIHVELAPGVSDPLAPPGGMLYNLQGRPDDRQRVAR